MESEELKNNNELQNYKEIVSKFFQDCREKKLFKKSYDSTMLCKIVTRLSVYELTDQATRRIDTYHKCSTSKNFLSDKENNALQFSRNISYIRDMISEFEIYLKLMIDLDINDNTTYGKLFNSIYKALKYEKCWKKLSDAFFLDLRNALTHMHYHYEFVDGSPHIVKWYDNDGNTHELSTEQLFLIISKIRIIIDNITRR